MVKRFGSEVPRIFTPPLRDLTTQTSLGFAVIEFAEQVLELDLYPWQKWLLVHALELNEDRTFRFRTVVVLVARQNGKSTLSQVLSLFFLYVLGTSLVIGTAQDLDLAKEIWLGVVEMVDDIPELAELKKHARTTNGQIELALETGERYKVKAANRRAGRGLSGDLILLDELREHQSWEAWGAITKTTMARANAQIWALSNAGDATSIVLRHLRKMTHRPLGDPDGIIAAEQLGQAPDDDDAALDEAEPEVDPSLGLFEWSAPPNCSTSDRAAWAMANPSLGHSITEATIASAAATDPEWVFRTEVLCQWSDGTLEGPFPPGVWEKSADRGSKLPEKARLAACVDVSADRSHAYVTVAGERADGKVHGEVIEARRGTEWVVPYLVETAPNGRPRHELFALGVVIQANGAPASSLLDELTAAGVKVVEWKGSDLGRGSGLFYDLVCQDRFRHLGQPALDIAAATAVTKPLGDAWVWDRRKSPTDIASLVAVTGAVWLVGPKPKTTKTPRIHAWPDEEVA